MPAHPRRPLALGALSLAVALGGAVTAMYHHEPEIGLRTGGSPQAQELYLHPGTAPTTEASTTTVPPTTVPGTAPRTTATTARPTVDGAPAGCVPGTYDERYHSCRWKPVTISGRVTDTAGHGIPNICLTSDIPTPSGTRTDAQGRFTMQASQSGLIYTVLACGPTGSEFGWVRQAAQSGPIQPGDSGTLDVVLTEQGGAYGRVVTEQGEPVVGVCVAGASAPTDAQGRFAIPGLDPGPQTIALMASGYGGCTAFALAHEYPVATVHPGAWAGPLTMVAAFGPLTAQ